LGLALDWPAFAHQDRAWARTLTWERAIHKQINETMTEAGVIQGSVQDFKSWVRWRTCVTWDAYSAIEPCSVVRACSIRDTWVLAESESAFGSPSVKSRLSSHAAGPTSDRRLLSFVRRSTSRPGMERKGKLPTSSSTLLTTTAASATL